MSASAVYLDSSAIVKLVVQEKGSAELLTLLAHWPERVSSALARLEVRRAVLRAGAPRSVVQRAEQVLHGIVAIRVDDAILDAASRVQPSTLRSLDAIHVVSALSIGGDLRALITYDERLAQAAANVSLTVWSPGFGRP